MISTREADRMIDGVERDLRRALANIPALKAAARNGAHWNSIGRAAQNVNQDIHSAKATMSRLIEGR